MAEPSSPLPPASGKTLTPDAIANLLASASAWADPGSEDQGLAHRTALLGDVLSTTHQLWSAGSEEIDIVAEKLGDGSRDGEHPYAWQ